MKKIYIGIDVGGSKIAGVALGTLGGKPKRKFISVFPRTEHGFLKTLEEGMAILRGKDRVAGIGVGLPGSVDYGRGVLIRAGNLRFIKNWNAKKFFARFGSHVQVDNDSRCFLRAEALRGAGRGYRNIVGVAIGTGIGGGIITNGEMYYGTHGRAGHVGHMVINHMKNLEQLGAKEAFLRLGNRSEIIGVGIANIINVLDPDIIILGGGGGLSKHVNPRTVRTIANKHVVRYMRGETPIVKGKLGEFAQAIGAALLFKK